MRRDEHGADHAPATILRQVLEPAAAWQRLINPEFVS
jgi:hypothetical protein